MFTVHLSKSFITVFVIYWTNVKLFYSKRAEFLPLNVCPEE